MRLKRSRAALFALAVLLLSSSPAGAVKTSLWTQDGADDFLSGDVTGVTVSSDGQVLLGAAWDSVVTGLPDVSQIWCLARDSKGRIIEYSNSLYRPDRYEIHTLIERRRYRRGRLASRQ